MSDGNIDRQPFFPTGIYLFLASLFTGSLAGLAGYLLGQYFYILFVFPLILLVLGWILYLPSLRFFPTGHVVYNGLCGLVMGLMIFLSFHYMEYSVFRSSQIQKARQATPPAASSAVDAFLKHETGWGGFPGYMIYQQNQYEPYVVYFVDGSIAHSLVFNMWRRNAWLYLAGEGLVLLLGASWFGVWMGKKLRKPVRDLPRT